MMNLGRFSSLAAIALMLNSISAQQASTVHVVKVGGAQLIFEPDTVFAGVGDFVQFDFYAINHSVVRSGPDTPCIPLAGGFYSGYFPASSKTEAASNGFIINITSTDPLYFYCSQGHHCQEGMVGIINPSNISQAQYKAAAANAAESLSPANGVQGGAVVAVNPDGAGIVTSVPALSTSTTTATSNSTISAMTSTGATAAPSASMATGSSVSSTPMTTTAPSNSASAAASATSAAVPASTSSGTAARFGLSTDIALLIMVLGYVGL